MIPYEAVFEGMLALARTFNRKDMDAHCRLDDPLGEAGPDETAAFVAELCERSPAHVEALGAETFGDLLWYVMGTGAQLWHEVAEASLSAAEDAVLALRDLYEHTFARHLSAWSGGGEGGRLAGACYMLWDMDGGLETIPLFNRPRRLVPTCFEVLDHALALDSPPCWESALHGLGHIATHHEVEVRSRIDGFLAAHAGRLPEQVVAYAQAARSGAVQ